jgi:flagellar hook assembly protein FlgD
LSVNDPLKSSRPYVAPGSPGQAEVRFGDETAEVTILDEGGKVIFHRSRLGSETIVWDGKDENGRIVESGVYLSRIQGRSGEVTLFPITVVR